MPYDFMNVDYENPEELTIFDDGDKQTVMIKSVQVKEEGFWIRVSLECPSDEMSKDISHFVYLPKPDDARKAKAFKLQRIKDFTTAFGLSKDEWMDPDTWIGHPAEAILGTETTENYGNQNTIKQLFAPE